MTTVTMLSPTFGAPTYIPGEPVQFHPMRIPWLRLCPSLVASCCDSGSTRPWRSRRPGPDCGPTVAGGRPRMTAATAGVVSITGHVDPHTGDVGD